LHFAICKENFTLVKLLLEHNADPNCPNEDGETPLYLATIRRNEPIVKLLLKKGANPNCADHYGGNALNFA
ncbi:hypothetical protein M441DRAFT_101590, partial [Trichoderma asperellum CBS 433.97]